MKTNRRIADARRAGGIVALNVFVEDQFRWKTELGIWVWCGGILYRAQDWTEIATCGMEPVQGLPSMGVEEAILHSIGLTTKALESSAG